MSLLTLSHINKSYQRPVLTDFSLSLPEKGLIVLTGPSGCGKTTLLHVLLGITKPDAGEIERRAGLRFSVVFQEDRLLPTLTAAENINVILREKLSAEELANSFSEVGLTGAEAYYPAGLSGGMKRRVAFLRACAYNGDVFVLDEPFSGLDSHAKGLVTKKLLKISRDKPVILVTHDPLPFRETAERMITLKPAVEEN